ncbi:30S ribosomal protein S18 [Mycobacterium sp. WMMD1722]|uniref:30S ribosomal protein S18 n=1 Tax=Mycobacterium sp. WMMD1722 TaxID=3404117 RepID=UPI003BF51460
MMAGKNQKARRQRPPLKEPARQKRNPLKAKGVTTIDYKDTALLRTFISERGKIRSRRVTGLTPQQQRQVATAIRNAREMALLPFVERRA